MAEKKEKYLTPIGHMKFCKTIINDKEYNVLKCPEGLKETDVCSFKFQLNFDPKTKEAKELLAKLDDEHNQIKNANFKPYKKDVAKDEETEALIETGLVAINFTSSYAPKMIDSALKECNVELGWGSKVRVKFVTKAVNNKGKIGLGRYTSIIQVLEPKSGGVDTSGFESTDGGFVAEAPASAGWEE